jgi:hypothetical protein
MIVKVGSLFSEAELVGFLQLSTVNSLHRLHRGGPKARAFELTESFLSLSSVFYR